MKPVPSHRTSLPDEQLALYAQDGCLASFEQLIKRFQVRLLNYLQHHTSSLHLAEDVVQETFLQAYQCLDQYDPRWKVSTWMYTIARRLLHKHLHQQARQPSLVESPELTDSCEPGDELAQAEQRQHLWKMIRNQLELDEFTALWMVYVEDASLLDVSEVIQRPYGTTKVYVSRARRRLAPLLKPFVDDPPQYHASGSAPHQYLANRRVG